jgi:hypothetical protein
VTRPGKTRHELSLDADEVRLVARTYIPRRKRGSYAQSQHAGQPQQDTPGTPGQSSTGLGVLARIEAKLDRLLKVWE